LIEIVTNKINFYFLGAIVVYFSDYASSYKKNENNALFFGKTGKMIKHLSWLLGLPNN
jgi:hypothetical protein